MLMPGARAEVNDMHSLVLRKIPRSGEDLPALGLGTWQQFDLAPGDREWSSARQTLQQFLAQGLRVIDSSPMYGKAEGAVGSMLAETDLTERAFIATKVWTTGRELGRKQIDQSFLRLCRERIDLFQVHNLLDLNTQLDTLRALKHDGRIRYIGVTHYTESAYSDLVRALQGEDVDFVQVNYSLLERSAERVVLPAARAAGVAVLVNRPFAEGDLFQRTHGKPLPEFAQDIGCASWAQFALKFILSHPAVTCALTGTNKPEHLIDNIGGACAPLPDAELRTRMANAFDKLG